MAEPAENNFPCSELCAGWHWFVPYRDDGFVFGPWPETGLEIERCDEDGRFESDDAALEFALAKAERCPECDRPMDPAGSEHPCKDA